MIKHKIQNLFFLLFPLSFLGLCGCAVAVLGIGAAGAGAFAYFNGKLTKTYEAEYNDTVHASSYTLKTLKIPITQTVADELTTEITARRLNGTPVVIEVVRIDADHTQVAVRTGSLGVWDKRVSEQIHSYIDQNLSQGFMKEEEAFENLKQDEIDTAVGETSQTEIQEENLADVAAPETIPAKPSKISGGRAQTEPTPEFVKIATDSIFIIFFSQNSNDLTKESLNKLDQVYEILLKYPHAGIALNGYSDSIGSVSYNDMISEIRANAVKSYLVGKGVDPNRIKAIGHGSKKFLDSNDSPAGRQLNRRVEIKLIYP